jgi:hypothetical protein
MNYLRGLSLMHSRQLFSRQPPSQGEPAWIVTINTNNLRALFLARHFLAGVLIGTAIFLAVLLVMN